MNATYPEQLLAIGPVAIRTGQTETRAPGHGTRVGTVECNTCGVSFLIAYSVHYRSPLSFEQCTRTLEARLAEDHRLGQEHQNGYVIDELLA